MKVAYVYVTDERGMDLVRYSALSLVLTQRRVCDIHLFCHHFRLDNSDRLHGALTEAGANLFVHQIMDDQLERHKTYGHVTSTCLLRLTAVDRLATAYDRIVCLDNDLLVFADLDLETLVLGSFPVAAVIDMDLSETGAIARSSVRPKDAARSPKYFNFGFMVYESRNWRSSEFSQRFSVALQHHDIACPYKVDCTSPDQCAANTVFAGNWLPLPASYNMQASARYTTDWKTASVRHYCGPRKFVPVSPFRNDGNDIAFLNRIRPRLGLPRLGIPLYHEILYRMNSLRKYPVNNALRGFLRLVAIRNLADEAIAANEQQRWRQ